MEKCDVLVVGGGPAGSSLAWGLKDSGLDVLVMDKQTFPRNKVCAGWITPAVVESLRIDLAAYGRSRTLQPIHGIRAGMLGAGTVEIQYRGDPISYGIRRCEFDHYLLERSGARLRLGESFREMAFRDNGWIVNGGIRASVVVGAGGHFCPVAGFAGAKLGRGEVVVAAKESEFRSPGATGEVTNGTVPELYFCSDLKGYGWVFRKGDYFNIGLGREDNYRLSEHIDEFCMFLRDRHRMPPVPPEKFCGHAYLLYHHARRPLSRQGVLLIGDSAGLAYPQSGEGIRPAVESGLLAAKVIREANGDYSAARLRRYDELIRCQFGGRKTDAIMRQRPPSRLRQSAARWLLSTDWFTRNIVINRWFLHTHQPKLALH